MSEPDDAQRQDVVVNAAPRGAEAEADALRTRMTATLALSDAVQQAAPVPQGWPKLFNLQAMQDAMAGYLGEHHAGLNFEQSTGLTAAFRSVGERYDQLALTKQELTSKQEEVLAVARQSIGPDFIQALADYFHKLEALLWTILNKIQAQGTLYLMDQEGFRGEELVADAEALLKHALPAYGELCEAGKLASFCPAFRDLPLDDPRSPYCRLHAATREALTGYQPLDSVRPFLGGQGIDEGHGMTDVQQWIAATRREQKFVNTQYITETLLEQWMTGVLEQKASQGSPDPDEIRQRLLLLVRRMLAHHSLLPSQTLASFAAENPSLSTDDLRGTRVMDFGNPLEQPNPRLGTVEFLLHLCSTHLQAMQAILKIKACLGINC